MNLRDIGQLPESFTIENRSEQIRIVPSELTGNPGFGMGCMGLTYATPLAQYYGLRYQTKEGTLVEVRLVYE